MVTTEQAKKILGDKCKNLSDTEAQSLIDFLYFVCEKSVDLTIKLRLEKKNKSSLPLVK